MRSLSFDVRDAVRGLRRDRAYTLTVVVTLTLTIGATTAVFSIVDGVLLKPLAYRESQRLVSIRETWRQFADKIPTLSVNEKHFEYWRQHTRTFESMAQYIVLPANMTGAGDAAQVQVARVSGSLFDVLRVQAAIGRTLTPGDEPSGRPETAVITDAAWRQRFSADRGVVGRSIVIDGRPRTIVGVLPAEFSLPSQRLAAAELFVPIHMDVSRTGWEGDHNNEAVGRLLAGATIDQAHAELDVLQAQVSQIATKEAGQPVTLASTLTPLSETAVGRTLGLAVAWAALLVFVKTAPIDLPRVTEVALDARVVGFAAAVSTFSGVLVALLPAWRTARSDVE